MRTHYLLLLVVAAFVAIATGEQIRCAVQRITDPVSFVVHQAAERN